MKEVGLIGLGSFGKFMVPHLKAYFDVSVYNRSDRSKEAKQLGISYISLEEAASKDIVIVSVPVQFLEDMIIRIKDFVRPGSLVIDVSSVKVRPVEYMLKHLPENVDILATHPLFGPQSGKDGIEGLNMVISPIRCKRTHNVIRFLKDELKLNVLERSPETHDRQMAYVQALTHLIGRAVNEMDIPDVEQKTLAYQNLLEIKRMLGRDSMDLFLTIQNENPYAKEVREQLLEELTKLHSGLH